MHIEQTVGIISIILLSVSAFMLILNYKEGKIAFLALAFYMIQIILLNLATLKAIALPQKATTYIGIFNNLLDAPLMLVFLSYFATSDKTKRWMRITLITYIAFEILLWILLGMSNKTLTMIIGPGLFIVTSYAIYFFVDLMRKSNFKRKDVGLSFMSGGLVFTYLCFLFIYVIFYIMKSPHIKDIYTIYHISFIIWCATLIVGISLITNRKKAKPAAPAPKPRRDDPNAFQYL